LRVVLQRVRSASVAVEGREIARVAHGLLVLVGIAVGDDAEMDVSSAAARIIDLRVFEDESGRMNRSLRDTGGEVLAVSQFTLCADTGKGRRPSFTQAAVPEVAEPLFDRFVTALRDEGVHVETGRFGAKMLVTLENEGPVTLVLDIESSSA